MQFSCFVKVDKVEDSFKILKSKEKPLAAYLFTNNKKLKEEFISNVSAGALVINDTTMHVNFISELQLNCFHLSAFKLYDLYLESYVSLHDLDPYLCFTTFFLA